MKRKIKISVFLCFSLLLLVGAGKQTVKLLNDRKLIDLSLAIELCLPGGDSATKEPDTESETGKVEEPEPEVKEEEIKGKEKIIISIRGREITYDAQPGFCEEDLKEQMYRDSEGDAVFHLVDDFAEAHLYRYAMAILEELAREKGITYTKE